MAITKRDEFGKAEIAFADLAKALSHPARIAILKLLAKNNECICGEIVDVLPLSQSTTSQHLKELLKAGLISGKVDGVKSCYCINWKKMEELKTILDKFFTHTEKLKSNCC